MMESIVALISSILGVFATWYILKKVTPWVQAYRNKKLESDQEAARRQAQKENQQANSDSDALERREREHDHPEG